MSTKWTPLSDDCDTVEAASIFESLVEAMVEYEAGEATATPKDREGRALGVISVADLDGQFIGVHIDLQGRDAKVVWAYRG